MISLVNFCLQIDCVQPMQAKKNAICAQNSPNMSQTVRSLLIAKSGPIKSTLSNVIVLMQFSSLPSLIPSSVSYQFTRKAAQTNSIPLRRGRGGGRRRLEEEEEEVALTATPRSLSTESSSPPSSAASCFESTFH